jgi:hypothetical protein
VRVLLGDGLAQRVIEKQMPTPPFLIVPTRHGLFGLFDGL